MLSIIGCRLGFNRYIVECKGEKSSKTHKNKIGFNRYIVECKVVNWQRYQSDEKQF